MRFTVRCDVPVCKESITLTRPANFAQLIAAAASVFGVDVFKLRLYSLLLVVVGEDVMEIARMDPKHIVEFPQHSSIFFVCPPDMRIPRSIPNQVQTVDSILEVLGSTKSGCEIPGDALLFVDKHIKEIIRMESWCSLPVERVKQILSRNTLNVSKVPFAPKPPAMYVRVHIF